MRQDRIKVCKRLEMLIVKIDYRKDLSYDVKQNILNAMRKVLWNAQTLNDEKFSINFRDSQINSPHQTPWKMYKVSNRKDKKNIREWISESDYYYLGRKLRVSNKTGHLLGNDLPFSKMTSYLKRNTHLIDNVNGLEQQAKYKLATNKEEYNQVVKNMKIISKELKKMNIKSSLVFDKRLSKNPDKVSVPYLTIRPILVKANYSKDY